MKECKHCQHFVLNVEKPRISRSSNRGMYIDSDIMLMATEGRLPNNRCGPNAILFEQKRYK